MINGVSLDDLLRLHPNPVIQFMFRVQDGALVMDTPETLAVFSQLMISNKSRAIDRAVAMNASNVLNNAKIIHDA